MQHLSAGALPDVLSSAVTFRMPLASTSNATLICGTPRGAGGIPRQLKLAQQVVVAGHLTLPLIDLDQHPWLVVAVGAEGLQQEEQAKTREFVLPCKSSCWMAQLPGSFPA